MYHYISLFIHIYIYIEDERSIVPSDSYDAWSDEEDKRLAPPAALYSFPVTEEDRVLEAYTLNGETIKNSKYLPAPTPPTRAPFANPLLSKKLQRWYLNKLNPSLLQKNETNASAFYTSSSITPDGKIFAPNRMNSNKTPSIFAGEDKKVSSIAGGRPSVVIYQNKLFADGDVIVIVMTSNRIWRNLLCVLLKVVIWIRM